MAQVITADTIRGFYHNEPFRAFEIITREGSVFAVPARNRIVISPSGNFVIVVGHHESLTQIAIRGIVQVRPRAGRVRRGKRNTSRRRKAG